MDRMSSFPPGRSAWLGGQARVRNVVRQEVIARYLSRHLTSLPGNMHGSLPGKMHGTVLDVGAGQGTQSVRLARAGHRVVAVEPDRHMREVLSQALAKEPAQVRERVEIVAAGVDRLADVAAGRRFDLVLLLGVLMYLPSTEPVLAQLADRAAVGGLVALAVRTTTSPMSTRSGRRRALWTWSTCSPSRPGAAWSSRTGTASASPSTPRSWTHRRPRTRRCSQICWTSRNGSGRATRSGTWVSLRCSCCAAPGTPRQRAGHEHPRPRRQRAGLGAGS